MSEEVKEYLDQSFSLLYETDLRKEISEVSTIRTIPAGQTLIDVGQYIKSIPLVVEGKIKIFREDDEGNELFLYYLEPGEACAISLVCTLADKVSQIRAEAVEDTTFIAMPIEKMDSFMLSYRSWYQFVVRTYGSRLNELLETIDSIAFHKMDERLLTYLEKNAKALGTNIIQGTHQEIAIELNTSREVVSRLLKQLEKKGVVKLGRNKVELL